MVSKRIPPEGGFKRRIMSNVEASKMGDLLRQHTTLVGERTLRFETGWDDERVATETAAGLNRKHASRFREELLGVLEVVTKEKTYRDPRCNLLAERFNELLVVIGDLAVAAGENDMLNRIHNLYMSPTERSMV